MDIKRLSSALLGFPLVVLILALGNKYVIDIFFAITAVISINEYFNAIKDKANPIKWIGYVSSISIAFISLIPNFDISYVGFLLPIIVVILFLQSIFTNMKYTIQDIAYTLLGICYIPLFILCIPLICTNAQSDFYLWYIVIAAWGTDVFAYLVGRVLKLGKHTFSKISPNKTIEGCIAGTVGALCISIIYTYICNRFFGAGLSYLAFSGLTIILSIISQIGDFAASSIKRYTGIKDFGDLIPGHGGMLDRIDSVIFIAPFAYLLSLIIL